MPLIVRCPGCSAEASVPEQLRGTAVLCPHCQRRFTAPQDAVSTVYNNVSPPSKPTPPPDDRKFCVECGTAIRRAAVVCPMCGVPQPTLTPPPPPPAPIQQDRPISTDRITAGIFALVLGCLGVHKFILGYTKQGIILLLVTVVSFGFLSWATFVVGVIEGIIYLTRTDDEFRATYVVGRKPWF